MANLFNLIILSRKHSLPVVGFRLDKYSYYKRGRRRRIKRLLISLMNSE